MSSQKGYVVLRKVLQYGAFYLKKGDAVPAEVPAELVATWVKAKHIGAAATEGAENPKRPAPNAK
jgi:hypothetical protein